MPRPMIKNVYNSTVSMSLDDIFQERHFTAERFLPQDILETPTDLSNTIKLKTKLAEIIRQTVSHVGIDINCLFL